VGVICRALAQIDGVDRENAAVASHFRRRKKDGYAVPPSASDAPITLAEINAVNREYWRRRGAV
jgi:hypothetical protein